MLSIEHLRNTLFVRPGIGNEGAEPMQILTGPKDGSLSEMKGSSSILHPWIHRFESREQDNTESP